MKRYLGVLAAMLFLAAGGEVGAAEMFTCRQADGRISYQQLPCNELQQDAAPSPPAAAAPAKPAPPAVLTRRKREVLELTVRLQRCRADYPDFTDRSQSVFVAWQRRHAATLSELSRELAGKLREARRVTIASHFCSDDLLQKMEPLTGMPDSRFESAEKTWWLFVQALKAADRATAARCLTGRAEARWKEKAEQLSDEDLRRLGEGVRSFKVQWGDDYQKEALAADDRRVTGVVFQNLNEEWRISDM